LLNALCRIEAMLQLFQKFITPEQKKLSDLIKKKGGDAVLDDEEAMKELAAAETSLSPPHGAHGTDPFDLAEFQHEIKDDPTDAIKKNAEFFNRKFDMQRRQIREDVARAVRREGDRIISAVTAGPHDRIVNPVRLTPPRLSYQINFKQLLLGPLSNMEGYGKCEYRCGMSSSLSYFRDGAGVSKRGISLWPSKIITSKRLLESLRVGWLVLISGL
jgi:hypothetical protein